MEYYCEVCLNYIKAKNNYKHFKSILHKEFGRCNYIELTIENPNMNNIDDIFYAYIIEHKKI